MNTNAKLKLNIPKQQPSLQRSSHLLFKYCSVSGHDVYELSVAIQQNTPKLRDLKQHLFITPHCFCELGIQEHFSWMGLGVFHEVAAKLLAEAVVLRRPDSSGGPACKVVRSPPRAGDLSDSLPGARKPQLLAWWSSLWGCLSVLVGPAAGFHIARTQREREKVKVALPCVP